MFMSSRGTHPIKREGADRREKRIVEREREKKKNVTCECGFRIMGPHDLDLPLVSHPRWICALRPVNFQIDGLVHMDIRIESPS